ncbi:hypothetical protein HTZ84_04925 [Haloterrigena sp. SYSU A558-1]|uniref:Envelope protein N-terminal domain-containing protein n=1 Tax=Haloterrigena gelatinilytica TaxID=2741724 RepID=A0ABX2L8Z8_9EURY|nr:twin-arginine translocation signal domain-containing protein [Haloterrigena gelatinilytica]NUC71659.1 hypothetical protein [Haloterrigena gelatinilytica]
MSTTQEMDDETEDVQTSGEGQPNVLMNRRTMLKTTGAVGASAVAFGSPQVTQEAEAIAPVVVAGGVAAASAASAAVGWAVREYEVLGSDDPAEGLTPDALKQSVYETARTRQSTNQSTFVDNRNIVETGLSHAVHADAKLAAFEELNAESDQQTVLDAAIAEIDSYETTVKKNLYKSWNESVNELNNLVSSAQSHADVTVTNVLYGDANDVDFSVNQWFEPRTNTVELPNGETFDAKQVYFEAGSIENTSSSSSVGGPNEVYWDLVDTSSQPFDAEDNWSSADDSAAYVVADTSEGTVEYLKYSTWNDLYTAIDSVFQNVRDGISLWVDEVYSQVQAGDINVEELITPRERAEMMTDDEEYPQAIADLMALNIAVDLEREAEIHLSSINGTLYGTLGFPSPPDTAIEAGNTYDPSNIGPVYLTYDVSRGHGTWEDYETGLDGGTAIFTSQPHPNSEYVIETNEGETATVTTSDFVAYDSNGNEVEMDADAASTWEVDLSGQLSVEIAEINSVEYEAVADETQYETIQLNESFEVVSFTNTETGEEESSASFTQSTPQDDSNYITQEEWDELQKQNQELIEKYEKSANGSGGFLDGGSSTKMVGYLAGGGALVAAIIAALKKDD